MQQKLLIVVSVSIGASKYEELHDSRVGFFGVNFENYLSSESLNGLFGARRFHSFLVVILLGKRSFVIKLLRTGNASQHFLSPSRKVLDSPL